MEIKLDKILGCLRESDSQLVVNGTELLAGDNVTLSPNLTNNTITISSTAGGGVISRPQVSTYANLESTYPAASNAGKVVFVETTTGIWILGTEKKAGDYYCNGSTWTYSPNQDRTTIKVADTIVADTEITFTAGSGIEITPDSNNKNITFTSTGGTSSDTASNIKTKLETLTGDDRLDASAIKNINGSDLFWEGTRAEYNAGINANGDIVTPDKYCFISDSSDEIVIPTQYTDEMAKAAVATEGYLKTELEPLYTEDKANIALKSELGTKVDKVTGKQLSTEDYTSIEKTKLSDIEANANNYVLPIGTTSTIGGLKPDGTTITVDSNGTITSVGGTSGGSNYTLPTASTDVLGGVKVDGTTIAINESGVISSTSGSSLDLFCINFGPSNLLTSTTSSITANISTVPLVATNAFGTNVTLNTSKTLDTTGYENGNYNLFLKEDGSLEAFKNEIILNGTTPASTSNWVQPDISYLAVGNEVSCACESNFGSPQAAFSKAIPFNWGCYDLTSGTFSPHWLTFYSPVPINPSNIRIYNRNFIDNTTFAATAGKFQGSNNNIDWTDLKTFSNSITGQQVYWDTAINTSGFYKYIRIYVTANTSYSSYPNSCWITSVFITATKSTRTNDIWFKTLGSKEAYIYNGTDWSTPYTGIPIGKFVVSGGVISSVLTNTYGQNSLNVTAQSSINPNSTLAVSLLSQLSSSTSSFVSSVMPNFSNYHATSVNTKYTSFFSGGWLILNSSATITIYSPVSLTFTGSTVPIPKGAVYSANVAGNFFACIGQ